MLWNIDSLKQITKHHKGYIYNTFLTKIAIYVTNYNDILIGLATYWHIAIYKLYVAGVAMNCHH